MDSHAITSQAREAREAREAWAPEKARRSKAPWAKEEARPWGFRHDLATNTYIYIYTYIYIHIYIYIVLFICPCICNCTCMYINIYIFIFIYIYIFNKMTSLEIVNIYQMHPALSKSWRRVIFSKNGKSTMVGLRHEDLWASVLLFSSRSRIEDSNSMFFISIEITWCCPPKSNMEAGRNETSNTDSIAGNCPVSFLMSLYCLSGVVEL